MAASPTSQLASVLARRGCVVVPTSTSTSTIAAWRGLALAAVADLTARGAAKSPGGVMGLGKQAGFRELVQKDPCRWDVNFDHLITDDPIRAAFAGGAARPSGPADAAAVGSELMAAIRVHMRTYIHDVLTAAFSGQYVQNAQGLVLAHPGCAPQWWHCDVSPLFGAGEGPGAGPTPAFFFTVFVPLYNPRHLSIGPTELALGTHLTTHNLGRTTVEEQYPDDAYVDAQLTLPGVERATMDCAPGDVVIMDGRLLHRGLGNASDQVRPLVYQSYCRPWYREWPRSQNEGRSVFE